MTVFEGKVNRRRGQQQGVEPGRLKDSLKNLVKHILQVFEQTQYCSTSLSQVQFLPKISVYMIH